MSAPLLQLQDMFMCLAEKPRAPKLTRAELRARRDALLAPAAQENGAGLLETPGDGAPLRPSGLEEARTEATGADTAGDDIHRCPGTRYVCVTCGMHPLMM